MPRLQIGPEDLQDGFVQGAESFGRNQSHRGQSCRRNQKDRRNAQEAANGKDHPHGHGAIL